MSAVLKFDIQDSFEVFQSMAHKQLDESLEKLRPLFEQDKPPTLLEISSALQDIKHELSGALLQEAVHSLNQQQRDQEFFPCPHCGRLVKKRDASRKIETRHGESLLTRPYCYCRHCKESFCPMDEALELSPRKKQFDLQKLALKFLAKMPFEEAAQLFYESTGVSFSDHSLHEFFSSFAEDMSPAKVMASADEIAQRIETAPGKRRPVLVVATDGALMPTRTKPGRNTKRGPGEYKEAKGFRIYLNSGNRIVHLASWHQIGGKKEIKEALKLAASRIPTDKVRICLIGDGAHWLWEVMVEAFPSGRQILDYFHVSEYIHAVAEAQYRHDSNKALHWAESTMARLNFTDGVRHVIAGLKRMKPTSKEAKEEIRKTVQYLERNKERIHYRGDRIGGYPIGSGGIESANKFICHTRLKRSGAWWLKENSNKMLALRCSLVNKTFDQIFARYSTKGKGNHGQCTNA